MKRFNQLLSNQYQQQNSQSIVSKQVYQKGSDAVLSESYDNQVKTNQASSAQASYEFNDINTHLQDLHELTAAIEDAEKNHDWKVLSDEIIEKFNRIADTEIPIILTEKSSEDSILVPRVIQGSLFTSARGEESDVNLRITTTAGQCIIGQGPDCLVSESTRKPGAIYSIVSIDDVNYKIRYSGDDVRLEKFSILPENSDSKIDID